MIRQGRDPLSKIPPLAHPTGFEPVTSAFGGLSSTLIWLDFFNDFCGLASPEIAVNRCSSLPTVPKLCQVRAPVGHILAGQLNNRIRHQGHYIVRNLARTPHTGNSIWRQAPFQIFRGSVELQDAASRPFHCAQSDPPSRLWELKLTRTLDRTLSRFSKDAT